MVYLNNMKRQNKTATKLTLVLALLTLFFIYNIARAIITTQRKIKDLNNAESDTERLREEYFLTYLKTRQVNTDDYLEKFSRNEMNYARDGDIVFVIRDSQLKDPVLNEQYQKLIQKDAHPTISNWQQWLSFLKNGI